MSRGLDHIVHAVRDLDAAAALYRSLGFTVGARNRHPWGTHNHIVQLPGFFIEILTFAEPYKLGSDGLSTLFAAYNRDFIAHGDGLSLLVLEAEDAKADEADFATAGVLRAPTMRFEREGKKPDGTPVKVGFSLTFVDDPRSPDIRFCTCRQHYPENFWNPAFQQHANSVKGVAGVVTVADVPDHHRTFFETYAGARAAAVEDGFAIATPRGTIEVITPAAFVHRFGVGAPGTANGARLAAIRFTVADPSLIQSAPALAGMSGVDNKAASVIGREDAMGAVLVFEPAA